MTLLNKVKAAKKWMVTSASWLLFLFIRYMCNHLSLFVAYDLPLRLTDKRHQVLHHLSYSYSFIFRPIHS